MPGSADTNLRRAYLQEELGLVLLRGIAAVSPVPRPDDVGVDAVCTLLERQEEHERQGRRALIPREACYVQLKASSVQTIPYSVAGLKWLMALELPFFFGSVDLSSASISLYSLNGGFMQAHLNRFRAPSVGLILNLAEPPGRSDPQVEVFLGPAIARWTIADIAAPDVYDRLVPLMRSWCREEMINIGLRQIDSLNFLRWTTGATPERAGGYHSTERAVAALAGIAPHIKVLALDAISRRDGEGWKVWRRVIEVLEHNAAFDESGPFLLHYFDELAATYKVQR